MSETMKVLIKSAGLGTGKLKFVRHTDTKWNVYRNDDDYIGSLWTGKNVGFLGCTSLLTPEEMILIAHEIDALSGKGSENDTPNTGS